jgi:phage shock protein PspC (stress-responsive transcriptional regulator)
MDPVKTAQPERPFEPKRLYRVKEGEWLVGVCRGLSAYLGLDVTIIRIAFVALAIVSMGMVGCVYAAMFFLTPEADTPRQKEAAFARPIFGSKSSG